jgi:hypothetical protein
MPTSVAALRSLAVGDLNGDSKQDLVVTSDTKYKVSVMFGDGLGGFGALQDVDSEVTASVIIGDFNTDGNADLATANNLTNNVGILSGNGKGTFGKAAIFPIGKWPPNEETP